LKTINWSTDYADLTDINFSGLQLKTIEDYYLVHWLHRFNGYKFFQVYN